MHNIIHKTKLIDGHLTICHADHHKSKTTVTGPIIS